MKENEKMEILVAVFLGMCLSGSGILGYYAFVKDFEDVEDKKK